MTKYCANCGRELKDEAKYCPECGQEYVPRHRADGSSGDEFKGPFDDFNNKSSKNPFESSSKKAEGHSPNTSTGNASESLPCGKICIVLFIVMLLFSAIVYFADTDDYPTDYDTSLIEESSRNLSNQDYLYDRTP